MKLGVLVNQMKALRDTVNALKFPEADKEVFKGEVVSIADVLLAVDLSQGFDHFLPDEYISYVQRIIIWLSQLHDSYNYRLNDEMAYCIRELVAKWDSRNDGRIVIFTMGEYGMRKAKRNKTSRNIDELLTISRSTGITITKEPIFIQVPNEFKDLIVANVVLFHEVGHFVDRDNYVTDMVYDEILPILNKNKTSRFIREWFPRYNNVELSTVSESETVIRNHISEYIADVFGAQYAAEHILCYLSFLASKSSNDDSKEHPSLKCRKKMVESFIDYCKNNKTDNPLLASILNYIPNLKMVSCPFTETELNDPILSFADSDQMINSFITLWSFVLRESKRAKIPKVGAANYKKVLALSYYQKLDTNIKKAINELMNRH